MIKMKKSILYKLLAIVIVATSLSSCQEDQEVSAVQSTANYPVATYTVTKGDINDFKQGDTLVYTITMDRMLEDDLSFVVQFGDDSETDEHEVEVSGGSLPAFTSETTIQMVAIQDNIPDGDKGLEFTISVTSLATKYLLNPTTVHPDVATTIKNFNDPIGLTVVFGWDDDAADFDLLSTQAPEVAWGNGGATGANPEIDQAVWSADPPGDYYYGFDAYDVPAEVNNYYLKVGHPDGTVENFEGVINISTHRTDFTQDFWDFWAIYTNRLLKVTLSADGTFTVVFEG